MCFTLILQLQGMLVSVGSPLLVFIVYSLTVDADPRQIPEYLLEEHLNLYAIADVIITVNQATVLSVLVVSSLLHLLIVVTRALELDPDILVVPLAGAAGHVAYLFFFVAAHEANSTGELIRIRKCIV